MGLWSSKEQEKAKELTINNPNIVGGEYKITPKAVENLNESISSTNGANQQQQQQQQQQPTADDSVFVKRIEDYEERLKKSFSNASKEVKELFESRYKSVPVCVDLQNAVNQCYKDNSQYPLNCVDISNKYIKCVEEERQNKFKLPPLTTALETEAGP